MIMEKTLKVFEQDLREDIANKIEKFIDILDQYLEAGELPVSSTIDAKKFIDTTVIDKL
jgi:uncharacterized protein YqeY